MRQVTVLLTGVTGTVPRAVRAAFSTRRWSPVAAASFRSSNFTRISGIFPSETLRLNLSPETSRELSTAVKNSATSALFHKAESIRSAVDDDVDSRVETLLDRIKQSQEENNTERELEQSLQLYDILKQSKQEDPDVFEVAFGIARIYDDQLEDGASAVIYYGEALAILETFSADSTAWTAYMRVTTLGALALCYENLGQHEEAEKYFDDAIGAYNEHCGQAVDSGDSEGEASDVDISLLADLNATAAMIHYHFAGNLLAQERWDDAKKVTEIALVLAENSRMPLGELEELQHCVHELWLEME